MDVHGHSHYTGSRAAQECEAYLGSEAVRTTYNLAELAIVVAGDHMIALERSLTEPVMTAAP